MEADEVADNVAHTQEACGALAENLLPVPVAEHLLETGSSGVWASRQQVKRVDGP